MTFEGDKSKLEQTLNKMGRKIRSSEPKTNMHQFKTDRGETLNLYDTGTLQVQGSPDVKTAFEAELQAFLATDTDNDSPLAPAPVLAGPLAGKRVFIVHGHDDTSREQLELVLHKLGLDPYVLASNGGNGLTIIEALESMIGKNSQQTSFGIVLMTPDDFGYAQKSGVDTGQPRARQNVVLEMGMLISSVGRANMAILVKGHLEKPSDADGILYIAFNNHVKETVPKLTKHLRSSGFQLDADKISHASS